MSVRTGLFRRLASDTRGKELVEFAAVVPVLMLLIIGVFWFGRGYSVYQALGRAAREGARVALSPTCATCGDTPNDPTATINNALRKSSLNPSAATINVTSNQILVPSNLPKYDQVPGVTVTITYPMQLNMPLLPSGMRRIVLTSKVSMRQEY
jgi:Flp pilus assembly protein TadG